MKAECKLFQVHRGETQSLLLTSFLLPWIISIVHVEYLGGKRYADGILQIILSVCKIMKYN